MKIIKKTLLFLLILNSTIGLRIGLAENLPVINFATTLDDSIKVQPNGELAGLEVDLIKNLGKKIGFIPKFTAYKLFSNTLNKVKNGEKDAGFSMITINKKRSIESFDFSFPYFVSGLSILSVENSEYKLFQGVDLISIFFDANIWTTLLVFGVFIFSIGKLFSFFVERRNKDKWRKEKPLTLSLAPRVFQALWFSVVNNSAHNLSGNSLPNAHWISRLVIIPLWVFSFLMTSIIIAQMSSKMTLQKLKISVENFSDLKNKPVGALESSTGADFLKENKFTKIKLYSKIDDAFLDMKNKKIRSIIYDHPIIVNFNKMAEEQGIKTNIIAPKITEEFYGIIFNKKFAQNNPKIIRSINLEIMKMLTDGHIAKLGIQWGWNSKPI
jgi:ABC-type amino acid transport substrate-binding protein